MDKLNIFEGYLSKQPGTEDRLTWALMNLIRISPIIRAAFLDLVRDEQKQPIPALTALRERECVVQTQTENLFAQEGRLVAIGITAEGEDVYDDVQLEDRGARYDGVVTFIAPENRRHQQESLTLTVESKRDSEVEAWQLMPSEASLGEEGQIKVDSQAVILAWRDIVSTLTDIELRGLVSPAERVFIRDFIDYVAANHSVLNPFEHFAVCRNDLDLLNRRCEMILREIDPTEAEQGPLPFIPVEFPSYKRIYLKAKDDARSWRITLEFWPGDTVAQAQEFWSKVDAKKLLALQNQNEDWRLVSNLHFMHWSNRCSATTSLAVNEYIEFWQSGEMKIDSIWPDDAGSYRYHWDCLVAKSLISPDDMEPIEAVRTEKNRPWISMSPGLGISYTWSAARASQLDRDGAFVFEVKEKIREATETWGEVPDFCS
ncbi:MAG: hypothetical protein F4Y39_12795 [Gemmatimonadetes bacterium]|nr:hypothetical protein [Gemmatimonadota bacterium]MYF75561.1 hypothetical protein [Gemmatimonadota bacterium]MYK51345.1 hypothetical protein [Gemmatimonadota bacterium]